MSSAFNIPAGYWLAPMEPDKAMWEKTYGNNPIDHYKQMRDSWINRHPAPPVDAVPGEPVAWMFPSITGGHVFYEGSTRPEGAPERAIPLYAASVASRAGSELVAVVEKAIAAALRQHGLTLLKNASGYEIDIWAPIVAQPQAGTPTQAEIDSGPHGGLGNIPADYAAAPTPQDSATPDRERAASLVAPNFNSWLDERIDSDMLGQPITRRRSLTDAALIGAHMGWHAALAATRASAGEAQS